MLIGMVLAALILQGAVSFFIGQSRLVGESESRRGAREAARSAMHVFLADLRRVEATGGVAAASGSSVTLNVPYAMGLVCASTVLNTTISLMPSDSVVLANARFAGYAWRDWSAGTYTYPALATISGGVTSACTNTGVRLFPGGGARTLTPTAGVGIRPGTPIFLYQRVTYDFEPDGVGSRLVRTVGAGDPEVVVERFEAASRFRFFEEGSADAVDDPPADLGTIRGLEIVLEGLGDRPRPGSGTVATAPLTLAVFFKNRPEV